MSKESSIRKAPLVQVAHSDSPLHQPTRSPDSQELDGLQNLANQSAGVKEINKIDRLANNQDAAVDEAPVVEDPAESSIGSFLGKVGEKAIKGKTVATGGAIAAAATNSDKMAVIKSNIANDTFVGIQHISQSIYSARDFYEKQDFKSFTACILDLTQGFVALEAKIKVTGLAPELIPVIGGAITGIRQWENLNRVDNSMEALEKITRKIKLEKGDEKVIKAFKKEQQISKIKHGAQSIIAFASIAAPFIPGGSTIFGILQAIIPTVSWIRDTWVSHVESTANEAKSKAERRLGLDESNDNSSDELSEIKDVMIQENQVNGLVGSGLITEESLTGNNFTIRKLVELRHEYEAATNALKSKNPFTEEAKTESLRLTEMKRGLDRAIKDYNSRMQKVVTGPLAKHFKPVTSNAVKNLHDYHLTCIQNIMKDGKKRQDEREKLETTFLGTLRSYCMKNEQKEKIINELYDGEVPKTIDIKLAEMTAETQDHFWSKTLTQIDNVLVEVEQSKATLIANMGKILNRNKKSILENSKGQGGLFQNAKDFDADVKQLINTLNL